VLILAGNIFHNQLEFEATAKATEGDLGSTWIPSKILISFCMSVHSLER